MARKLQPALGEGMFDTMVFTKALGALCGALLIFLLGSWLSSSLIVPGSRNLPPAFVVDTGAEVDAETDTAAAAPVELSIAEAFQMADASAGERVWGQCRACHQLEAGRNGVGPYLHNVVGRQIGSVDGFNYSGALPTDEIWTIENLYAYLENPRGWAPGTSMSFAGLRSQMDRVNVIALLIENTPDFDPALLPEAPAEEAALEDELAEEAVAEEAVTEEDEAAVAEAVEDEAVTEDVAADARAEDAETDVVEAPADEVVEEDVAAAEAVPGEAVEEEAVAAAPAEEAVEEDLAAVDEAVTEEAVEEEAVAEAAPEADTGAMTEIEAMVAAGDVAAGQRVWNQCRACHVADAEQNRVGPHLVGIVGRPAEAVEGFRYSGALPDVIWTADELYAYLENPREYAPGTSMAFAGLRNQADRINVIAYLQSLQ